MDAEVVGPDSEYGLWHGTVEYSYAVMEAVRAQAVNGFTSFGHGGLEIGGVLYGERRGDVVRILAHAELLCEHANGPGFVLAEKDESAFRELMKAPPGMRTVGWYCSHTRTGLALNPNDCAIMERFFGERSVALIVKPTHFGPVEATFYLQGVAEPGPHFSVLVARQQPAAKPAATFSAVPSRVATPVPDKIPEKAAVAPAVLAPIRKSLYRRPKRQWMWAAFASIVGVIAYFALRPAATTAHVPERLGLQAYNIPGRQVRIEWNRQAAPIREAKGGTLEIADGTAHYALPLSADQLQSSSLTYGRQSDAVSIALKLPGGIKESVQVVSSPGSQPDGPAPPGSAPSNAPPPALPATGNPSSSLQQPSGAERRAPLKPFELKTNQPRKQADLALPEPPTATLVATAPAALAVPLAAISPLRQPRSGRLIWTGSLKRRGVVEFDGAAATLGAMSGALPGAAGRIAAYPAEFGSDGLTVYVTDASRHNRTEAPGPQTGGNRMHFIWDPERVKQLTVLEAPGPGNRYSRMSLRNDARSCSAIVVEWSVP